MHGEYLQKNGTDTRKENLVTRKSSHEKLARTGIGKIRGLEKVITKNWHGQLVEKSVNLENGLKKIGPSRGTGVGETQKVLRKHLDPIVAQV